MLLAALGCIWEPLLLGSVRLQPVICFLERTIRQESVLQLVADAAQ